MSFNPKTGGSAAVPYNPEMRRAFQDEMRIAAEAMKRDEERKAKAAVPDADEHV